MSSTDSKKFKGPLAATAFHIVISGDLAWSSWVPGLEIKTFRSLTAVRLPERFHFPAICMANLRAPLANAFCSALGICESNYFGVRHESFHFPTTAAFATPRCARKVLIQIAAASSRCTLFESIPHK